MSSSELFVRGKKQSEVSIKSSPRSFTQRISCRIRVQCLAEGVQLGVSYAQECHDAYTLISKSHCGCQIEENVQVEQKPEALTLIVDRRTE